MNTKSLIYFLLLLFFNSYSASAQDKIQINLDALEYFNSYLSDKNLMADIAGELVYNEYSNSLLYSSTTLMYVDPTAQNEILFKSFVSFQIPLNDIVKIEELIYDKDGIITLGYNFHLSQEVKRRVESKKKGGFLDKTEKYFPEVSFFIEKDLDAKQLVKVKKIVRDIFESFYIETKSMN